MKMPAILILFAALISLSACSSISGNVVPKSGPAMEAVYDSIGNQNNLHDSIETRHCLFPTLKQFRENNTAVRNAYHSYQFHKIPNPELQMYLYPHLGGRDQIPVPGYTTEFNVYNRDHYAL